jgi:hypothetical protein
MGWDMSITSTFMSIPVSYALQRIALVLVVISIFLMRIVKLGGWTKYKLKIHDFISTSACTLLVLSLPRMLTFAYSSLVSGRLSPLIAIHGLLGIVIVVVGLLYVINRRSIKVKRAWKAKRYMQIFTIFWILNFLGGLFILSTFFHRL